MGRRLVRGDRLIEMLLGASPGESVLVGREQWVSLDDLQFEVTTDFGEGEVRFVTLDEEQNDIDPEALYEVVR